MKLYDITEVLFICPTRWDILGLKQGYAKWFGKVVGRVTFPHSDDSDFIVFYYTCKITKNLSIEKLCVTNFKHAPYNHLLSLQMLIFFGGGGGGGGRGVIMRANMETT